MFNPLLPHASALWVRTAVHCLPFGAIEWLTAAWAIFGEVKGFCVFLPELWQDFHNFRDDIARFLHDHGIANSHIKPLNLIFIVERRPCHRSSSELHRGEERDWGDCPCAPHLELNILDDCGSLFRFELIGARPAGGFCGRAKITLEWEIIYFKNEPIDFERETFPLLLPFLEEYFRLLHSLEESILPVHREPKLCDALQNPALSFDAACVDCISVERVAEDPKIPFCSHFRIKLANRACGCIPRICELFFFREILIQAFQRFFGHVDFSANLDEADV